MTLPNNITAKTLSISCHSRELELFCSKWVEATLYLCVVGRSSSGNQSAFKISTPSQVLLQIPHMTGFFLKETNKACQILLLQFTSVRPEKCPSQVKPEAVERFETWGRGGLLVHQTQRIQILKMVFTKFVGPELLRKHQCPVCL